MYSKILTKCCNTLLGSGGPKSAAFRLIQMQTSSRSVATYPSHQILQNVQVNIVEMCFSLVSP